MTSGEGKALDPPRRGPAWCWHWESSRSSWWWERVAAALMLAARQDREDSGPASVPTDFVAPVSSGGYSWRRTDESLEQFQARIARENASSKP